MNTTIQQATSKQFNDMIAYSKLPVLVDFWATWCGPCRAQHPILERFANDYQDRINIVKINVDEEPQLAEQFNITSIPTLMIFHQGRLVDRFAGLRTQDELYSVFKKLNYL